MKNIFKKILIILLILVPSSIYANNNISTIAENWFNKYSIKIEKQYNKTETIQFFENFSKKIDLIKFKKKFNKNQLILLNDLILLSNEKIFEIKLKQLENKNKFKINLNKTISLFKNKLYNKDYIFLDNGVWYYYKFKSQWNFEKGAILTKENLKLSGIDIQKDLVIINNDNSISFVTNFKKIKLISDDIIYGIPGKYNFLKEIKDDKVKLTNDTDLVFKEIKKTSLNITRGKTKEEKIKSIYNYVLKNTEYTQGFSLDDPNIFSGLETFNRKNGVCEGYAKIFLYMLAFANIKDVEVIRGFVIDAQDFPDVGHAWVRIGNKYYDPTFDDPIGAKKTLKFSEYIFYGLPYDLFYTNRYKYSEIPEHIFKESLVNRKILIMKNIGNILEKYKNSKYNILKPYILKLKYGIKIDKILDINDLSKIIPYYLVENFKFTKGGATKNIKKMEFYVIKEGDIENLITQINYNFNGFYLFKWQLDNGSYEYRMAYNVLYN